MIVLVDVDGTVADIHVPWLGMYNADYHDRLTLAHITKWEMHELVKPECGRKIYKYLEDPKLYEKAPVIEGALNGVNTLRKMGHEIVFVSAGFYFSKVEWLGKYGFLSSDDWRNAEDVVIASNKGLIKGDVIIDDYPKNLDRAGAFMKILFRRPWNVGSRYQGRNWEEIVQMRCFER
jgi:5'(3')-deoxyribonucleotidase